MQSTIQPLTSDGTIVRYTCGYADTFASEQTLAEHHQYVTSMTDKTALPLAFCYAITLAAIVIARLVLAYARNDRQHGAEVHAARMEELRVNATPDDAENAPQLIYTATHRETLATQTITACDVSIEDGILNFLGRYVPSLDDTPTVATLPAAEYVVTSKPQ